MPLPESHLEALEGCLWIHREQLRGLDDVISSRDHDLAVFHETVLTLGRDRRVLSALGDLHDHPERSRRVSASTFFNAHRVPVPRDADVRFLGPLDRPRVEAVFSHGDLAYALVWDAESGFEILAGSRQPLESQRERAG